ncbi:MAG: alpha/beta hydrolase [Acidimicrobiia bacterium]|nr:alpha/beta hydrolase [Acidimicrobiia bacterium]MYC58418.1 alpha/beta hydrolase [Acidimicrobiia bacterium]MYI30476.1 alpha/beta hydrolase [Acidimicrobiia bacterium]
MLPPGEWITLPTGRVFVRHVKGPAGSPTVMLLHGWTVTADLNWYLIYTPLAQRASVVAFDHRGHGTGIATKRFTLADCASDVLAIADALTLEQFICVGYSMGGAIAQLAARQAPERITGIVLGATSTSFRGQGFRSARFSLMPVVAGISRKIPRNLRQWSWQKVVCKVIANGFSRWAQAEVLKGDPQAMLDAGTELFRFNSSPWIAELSMPFAQICTKGDSVVPDYLQEELSLTVPNIAVFSYQGGHSSVVTDSASFWDCMNSALDHLGVPQASLTDQKHLAKQ